MRDATHYARRSGQVVGPERGAEWCPRLYWDAPVPLNPHAGIAGPDLAAVINHGRWVVQCPAPGCGGAQLAALDDPRFMCVNCGNAANRGAWRPVVFPPAKADIAAVLEDRTDPTQQNWSPGESVADLVAENTALEPPPIEIREPVDPPRDDPPRDDPPPAEPLLLV